MNTATTALCCLVGFAISWLVTEHGLRFLRWADETFNRLTTLPEDGVDECESWE